MRSMWRYVHARTIARIWPRLKPRIANHTAALDAHIRRTIEVREFFSILQIGAFDGVSNDHVHNLIRDYPHVTATLLEPQPRAHESLRALWDGTPRVVALRAAIADRCGERPLYVIAEQHRHRHPFPDQVASFSRAHVETACARYVWCPSADFVASVPVQTIDWPTLSSRHGPFNLVAIDTEGYDGDVIHQIDFQQGKPDIILYEHCHLTMGMRQRCIHLLNRQGYVVRQVSKTDTVAMRSGSPGF